MSLIQHARGLMQVMAAPTRNGAGRDPAPGGVHPAADGPIGEVLAGEPSDEAIEQARREWEAQPGHQ